MDCEVCETFPSEAERWRELVCNLQRRRELYGDDHKRVIESMDSLVDALDGFGGSSVTDILRNLLIAFPELGTSFATQEQQDALRAAREAVK